MRKTRPVRRAFARTAALTLTSAALGAVLVAPAYADPGPGFGGPGGGLGGHATLQPRNLLVSRAVYEPTSKLTAGSTELPPGCTTGCVTATAGAAYPQVWNNVLADESFGVT